MADGGVSDGAVILPGVTRERILGLVAPVLPAGVAVAVVENPVLDRVEVWLTARWWRRWWPGLRRRALVAACSAVADAPAGVVVRVHWR